MPTYTYRAMDAVGKSVEAEITASNFEAAIDGIRETGYYPISIVRKPMTEEQLRRHVLVAALVALMGGLITGLWCLAYGDLPLVFLALTLICLIGVTKAALTLVGNNGDKENEVKEGGDD